jgi:hypothetical protein
MSMLDSLSNLANVINRTAVATELRDRHTSMASNINAALWNETMGMYTNKRSRGDNGTSDRISPFNFHPMISGAVRCSGVSTRMIHWMSAIGSYTVARVEASNRVIQQHALG